MAQKRPAAKRASKESKNEQEEKGRLMAASRQAAEFYKECLLFLNRLDIPFMIGGTYAVSAYTGVQRATKDLDVFSKPSDYPRLVNAFVEEGFKVTVADERWIAKVWKGGYFVDIIFASLNAITPVTDAWFHKSPVMEVLGVKVPILPPTESLLAKMFIENRTRYDGNDVAHLILRLGKEIDWKRLLAYMDQYWEVLLVHLLRFRFIYPSERDMVPKWIVEELLNRLQHQMSLPPAQMKACRGRLFSVEDFAIDVAEWGFADVVGLHDEKKIGS